MRKDIEFPEVKDVYLALIKNEEDGSNEWTVYLINNSREGIESIMLVSRGHHKDGRKTSTFRHAYKIIPARSSQKVELMMEEVFEFTNEFLLTYFQNGKLYDKIFKAPAGTLNSMNLEEVPVMNVKGVLIQ